MNRKNELNNEKNKELKDSVECHLVIARLNRYLVGERMPERLLGEVEHHLFFCSSCKGILKKRKSTLQSMLKLKQEMFVLSPSSVESSEKLKKKALLLTCLTEKQEHLNQQIRLKKINNERPIIAPGILEPPQSVTPPASQSTPKPLHWKSLSVAFLLAIGLIVINHVGADPTKLFGQKLFSIVEEDKPQNKTLIVEKSSVSDEMKNELSKSTVFDTVNIQEPKNPLSVIQWLEKFEPSPVIQEKPSAVLDFAFECMKNEVFDSNIFNQKELLNESCTPISIKKDLVVPPSVGLHQNEKLKTSFLKTKSSVQRGRLKKTNHKNKPKASIRKNKSLVQIY